MKNNGDKIRQMTDQQLALLIQCPNDSMDAEIICDSVTDCHECCLQWIQEKVEQTTPVCNVCGAYLVAGKCTVCLKKRRGMEGQDDPEEEAFRQDMADYMGGIDI
ncbi:hypothetical protein [Anaerotalea alkaliphila]|uniref:Uncharacterized protein n=1 Tax=Anaerotalea alkaliphila TaxID=2662126 RepID=A0A7X5KN53_9FIRM|nr:hypothetical protein [Anaerotalea alkaliphila]NDL68509.1 hypothetical protein [Anaerotalea alkaliphila]